MLLCLANKLFIEVSYKRLISSKYLKYYKSLCPCAFSCFYYLSNVFIGQDTLSAVLKFATFLKT